MAKRIRRWVSMQGETHVVATVTAISGYRYEAEALGTYKCETDVGTAAITDFSWSLGPTGLKSGGEVVLLAGLPEQDRVEVEVALAKAAKGQVAAYMRRLRAEAQHPFRAVA